MLAAKRNLPVPGPEKREGKGSEPLWRFPLFVFTLSAAEITTLSPRSSITALVQIAGWISHPSKSQTTPRLFHSQTAGPKRNPCGQPMPATNIVPMARAFVTALHTGQFWKKMAPSEWKRSFARLNFLIALSISSLGFLSRNASSVGFTSADVIGGFGMVEPYHFSRRCSGLQQPKASHCHSLGTSIS